MAVLGTLSLFVNKAYAIDDPLFLWLGKHVLEHPLDFFGFDVNWYGLAMPMHEVTMNPPLAGYFIAAVGALAGFSEVALHTAFLIPAAAVCLGTYRLAEDLCERPLLASLMGLLTPVFLVSSTSVMCDTMMLAFWCWSVNCWRRGLRDERMGLLVLAAVLASCAAMTKYFGLALVPLLGVHGLLVRRGIGRWLLPLLVPVGVALAYELGTSALYGHGLIAGARDYASSLRADTSPRFLRTVLTGLVFCGGCVVTAVFLGPLLCRARWTLGGLGLLFLLALSAPHRLLGLGNATLATDARWLDLQILLMAYGGAVVILLALAEPLRRLDADSVLLGAWILGTFAFATFVNWVNNGRSVLPMAPAVGILFARRLELRSAAGPWRARRVLVPALGAAILLAVLVTHADSRWAGQARRAATELAREYGGDKPLYFQGHWGFQYYAALVGARRFDPKFDVLKKGSVVVIPTNNYGTRELPPTHVSKVAVREYPGFPWVHTATLGSGACFYASNIAPLPFAIGGGFPDRYTVWRVEKGFSFTVD